MAYKFKTYAELGDVIKTAKPEFADQNSESVGLRFAEKYGDEYKVRVDEESERAPFAYDPEEGFNLLKTVGNIPFSAGQVVGDIATAVTSPIETGEGILRGAAGAAEMALGTDISPENKRVAAQLGEGIAGMAGFDKVGDEYEFTGRGLQERPLDAGGLLAGGVGAAAKGVGMAGKAAGASRLAKGAEMVGKAAQIADPTIAVPRAAVAATKAAGSVGAKGVKWAGNKLVVNPLRNKWKGSRAAAALDDAEQMFEGIKANAGPEFESRLNDLMGRAGEVASKGKEDMLARLAKIREGSERLAGEAVEEVSGGYAKKPTTGGFLKGLIAQTLGFTTGLGPRIVDEIMDISKLDDQTNRNIMLKAANEDYVPGSGAQTIGEEVIEELAKDIHKWEEIQKTASTASRKALRMDELKTSTDNLKRTILSDDELVSGFGIRTTPSRKTYESTVEPGTVMGEATPLSQRTDIMPPKQRVQGAIMEGPEISYLDMEGRPAGQVPRYEVENLGEVSVDLSKSPILKLGENVEAVKLAFKKVFDLPQNATIKDLDIAKRAIDNAIDASSGSAQAALQRLRGVVYETITQTYDDPAIRRQLGIPEGVTNPYIQAMAQYEGYITRLNGLAKSLKVKDTQVKFAGTPLEVLRQTGNPQEVVKAVINAFGEGDSEIAMGNLTRLLEETGNTTLMPKVIGFSMRPVFGKGLVIRSEISQIGRGLLGFNLLGTLAAPVAMLGFSPKYGGMVLSYAMSPAGSKRIAAMPRQGVEAAKAGAAGVVARAKGAGAQVRAMAAEKFNKKAKDVTPNEIAQVENDIADANAVLARMDREEVTRMKSLIRGGAMEERAEQAGQRSQQRNILSNLSNVQAR